MMLTIRTKVAMVVAKGIHDEDMDDDDDDIFLVKDYDGITNKLSVNWLERPMCRHLDSAADYMTIGYGCG